MATASSDGRSHSSAMGIAAFSSSYDEVIAASRICIVRRGEELTGSPSVTTIPAPPFCVPAVEVREGSTRHLAAAFVEMRWMYGPNLSSLPSVTLRSFYC